jgi:predicted nucleic-acid-binding Zn-ribbon protein
MKCKRCTSDNVVVQNLQTTKRRGLLMWLFWIVIIVMTFGFALIIPLLTNTKHKLRTMVICQDCGYTWAIR